MNRRNELKLPSQPIVNPKGQYKVGLASEHIQVVSTRSTVQEEEVVTVSIATSIDTRDILNKRKVKVGITLKRNNLIYVCYTRTREYTLLHLNCMIYIIALVNICDASFDSLDDCECPLETREISDVAFT